MKIKFKFKPESEKPIKVGDKVRIKKDWYNGLDFCSISEEECKKEIHTICKVTDDNFDMEEWDRPDLQACTILVSVTGQFWTVPLVCLEKVIIKPKQKVKMVSEKTISQIKGKPVIKSRANPIKGRIKHG